jgi:hypothetical protein
MFIKPSERDYLKMLAVDKFNRQFGRDIDYLQCDIFSITAGVNSDIAYEITTREQNDFVRLRIYLNFNEKQSYLTSYRLYEDETFRTDVLGDEIWVTKGVIVKGLYPFNWIGSGSIAPNGSILLESGTARVMLENSGFVLLESA